MWNNKCYVYIMTLKMILKISVIFQKQNIISFYFVDFGLKYETRHVFERICAHENNLKECQIQYLRGILF